MLGAIGVGSFAVLAGGLGRLLQNRFDVSGERSALDLPAPAPRPPTPAGECRARHRRASHRSSWRTPSFYRIDTALVVPQVSKDSWSAEDRRVGRPPDGVDASTTCSPDRRSSATSRCRVCRTRWAATSSATRSGRACCSRTSSKRRGVQAGADPAGEQVGRRVDAWNPGRGRSWTAAMRCWRSR